MLRRNIAGVKEGDYSVEYGLTELGRQMMPVMDSLADFGAHYKATVS